MAQTSRSSDIPAQSCHPALAQRDNVRSFCQREEKRKLRRVAIALKISSDLLVVYRWNAAQLKCRVLKVEQILRCSGLSVRPVRNTLLPNPAAAILTTISRLIEERRISVEAQ